MPRQPRVAPGGQIYHVLNRANGRLRLFRKDDDFLAFYRVLRPLRASCVKRAQDWRWSSLHARLHGPQEIRALLSDSPIDLPQDWTAQVNRPQSVAEEEAIQLSTRRQRTLGDAAWVQATVRQYNLQSTLRDRGGQRKNGAMIDPLV